MAKARRPPFDVIWARRVYESGWSLRAIAKESTYCYGTVRNKLLEDGVILRPPGGNRRAKPALAA